MFNNDKKINELRSNFKHFPQQGAPQPKAHYVKEETSAKFNFEELLRLNKEAKGELFPPSQPSTEIEVVKDYIRSSYDTIRTNSLTKKIELALMGKKKELSDRDVNGWLNYLWSYATYTSVDGRNGKETVKKVTIDKNKLYTLIENDDFAPEYDPIDEYFQRVAPLAEGTSTTPEIDRFIKCFKCENAAEVVEKYVKAWLSGVFVNYFTNGKYDGILILQSDQGVGKTTAIEHYLLNPFKEYVVKSFDWNSNNKDELLKMATSLVIFDDELTATRKSEVAELKKITSMTYINNIRPAYGRTTVNYKRTASFIGATNSTNIINDDTGDRRFLILEVTGIDWAGIANIDYDLLWSEAYNYFHLQGNKVEIESEIIKANNQRFKFISAEEEYLERYFDFHQPGNVWMTSTEVLDLLKQEVPNFHTDVSKLGKALGRKGKKPRSKRIAGKSLYRYHLHKIDNAGRQQIFGAMATGDNDASTLIDFEEIVLGKKTA